MQQIPLMTRVFATLTSLGCLIFAVAVTAQAADDSTMPDETQAADQSGKQTAKFDIVKFPSGKLSICGILWKPPGNGPFPVVVYNHGSEQRNGNIGYGSIGSFYTQNGFAVLLPLRRGHSFSAQNRVLCTSDGEYFNDRVSKLSDGVSDPEKKDQIWLEQQDVDNQDVVAAVDWLKTQSFADPKMMIMSGISFGGIQTILAAEKGLGMRAFVPFAPGAMSWRGVPELHDRLKNALVSAKAPVFLIQAQNDYNLGPSQYLGPVLDRKGPPNRHRVYAPFEVENGPAGGHSGFAMRGMEFWSPDMNAFLKDVFVATAPTLRVSAEAISKPVGTTDRKTIPTP